MERQNQNGFTLLEVIIAISILTFGILAVASMETASIRGNAFSMSMTEATTHGAERMEKLIARPYTHSDLSAGPTHTDPSPPPGFTITWTVIDNSPVTDTKTVRVKVDWTDHGVSKSVILPRIIPRVI